MGQRKMPQQRPGSSHQDYQTPDDFLQAVKRRLGIFVFGLDIMASRSNACAKAFFTRRDDAYRQASWRASRDRWSWLNPEFGDIGRAAARCRQEMQQGGAKIAFLTPASVGANWYRDHIHKQRGAQVLYLNGRITFVGEADPYPKDLMLTLFAPGLRWDAEVWRWRG